MSKSRPVLKVSTAVRAGGMTYQHNRRALKVRSGVKSGGIDPQGAGNHNRIARAVKAVVTRFADPIARALRK